MALDPAFNNSIKQFIGGQLPDWWRMPTTQAATPVQAHTPSISAGHGFSGTGFPASSGGMQFPTGEELYPYSESYTGLPKQYRDQLLKALMPRLTDAVENMPQNIDDYTNSAMSGYKTQLNNILKEVMPTAIGRLANRGVLDSSVAGQSLGEVQQRAFQDTAEKSYDMASQNAQLKAAMPEVLANIAQLGKFSKSYEEDKTVMYQTMAKMLMGMM